jgi:peptide/nickel transport system ATP-binding protein
MSAPVLEVKNLVCEYKLKRTSLFGPAPVLRAVDGVSLSIMPGRSFAIVGESGSGKTTLARTVMALETPQSGTVRLNGKDIFSMSAADLRQARRDIKMVFQDPYESLDPRLKVGESIADPLDALGRTRNRQERKQRVSEALEAVGLRATDADKFPHEFSGGQRQRIAIARALITRPALIVADEPVSALDLSVQAQVLNLMRDLRERYNVAYLFISHNLAVVRHIADEVAVMHKGTFVEQGSVAEIFAHPRHTYTKLLLSAVLKPEARRRPMALPSYP